MTMKYVCELCGMIYDEDLGDVKHGIPAGTRFEDLPEDYECPGCYSEREAFSPRRPRTLRRVSAATPMPTLACAGVKEISDK